MLVLQLLMTNQLMLLFYLLLAFKCRLLELFHVMLFVDEFLR